MNGTFGINRNPDRFRDAIDGLRRAGDQAHVPLLEACRDGLLDVAYALNPAVSLPMGKMRASKRPVLAIIGGDEGCPSVPGVWHCVPGLARCAHSAIIHAAGADPSHYRMAIEQAQQYGRTLLIETGTAHAEAWAKLLPGIPKVVIWPREGIHPFPARMQVPH